MGAGGGWGSSVTVLGIMGLKSQVSTGIPKLKTGEGGVIGGNFQILPLSFRAALWTQTGLSWQKLWLHQGPWHMVTAEHSVACWKKLWTEF